MPTEVTDPNLLRQLNAQEVTDPALLAQLEGRPREQYGPPEPSSQAGDIAKSAGVGLGRGLIGLAGVPGDLGSLLNRGIDWSAGKLGLPVAPADYNLGTSAQIQRGVEGATGKFYEPQTPAGRVAETAGSFVPAMVGGPESLAIKALTRVAAPTAALEATKQVTDNPYAQAAAGIGATVLSHRALQTPAPTSEALMSMGPKVALQNPLSLRWNFSRRIVNTLSDVIKQELRQGQIPSGRCRSNLSHHRGHEDSAKRAVSYHRGHSKDAGEIKRPGQEIRHRRQRGLLERDQDARRVPGKCAPVPCDVRESSRGREPYPRGAGELCSRSLGGSSGRKNTQRRSAGCFYLFRREPWKRNTTEASAAPYQPHGPPRILGRGSRQYRKRRPRIHCRQRAPGDRQVPRRRRRSGNAGVWQRRCTISSARQELLPVLPWATPQEKSGITLLLARPTK